MIGNAVTLLVGAILIMAGLIAVSILFSAAFLIVMLRKLKPGNALLGRLRLRGSLIQFSSALSLYVLGACQSRSALPPSRGTLIGPPWPPNPLQTVEIKDLFPAAGDQTPARVQALLGRAPEHPVPTRISAENRPVLPCGNRFGHQGKFWLGF